MSSFFDLLRTGLAARRFAPARHGSAELDARARLRLLCAALERIAASSACPQARLVSVEALCAQLREAIEAIVLSPHSGEIPLPLDDTDRFEVHRLALTRCRDLLRHIHADLCEQSDAPAGSNEMHPTPRALLAQVRALEMQSLLLVVATSVQVALPAKEWDELCVLALPLWRVGVFDEAFAVGPGAARDAPAAWGRACSPRARFTLPLLLRLLEPLGLDAGERQEALRHAMDGCAEVGVSIDSASHARPGALGPTLRVSRQHVVRLDTRAVLQRLQSHASETLVPRLLKAWGAEQVLGPLMRPPYADVSACFGWPDAAQDGVVPARQQPLLWKGVDAHRAVFTRTGGSPPLQIGQLVVILPPSPPASGRRPSGRPGAGPSGALAGRVVSLCQRVGDASPAGDHDLGVRFWQGVPRPVRVRWRDASVSESGQAAMQVAWLLEAPGVDAPGEPSSLLVQRGTWRGAAGVWIDSPERGVQAWQVTGCLEQGLDHERIALLPAG